MGLDQYLLDKIRSHDYSWLASSGRLPSMARSRKVQLNNEEKNPSIEMNAEQTPMLELVNKYLKTGILTVVIPWISDVR